MKSYQKYHNSPFRIDEGIVIKKTAGIYYVESGRENHPVVCNLAIPTRKQATDPGKTFESRRKNTKPARHSDQVDTVVVGDIVRFIQADHGTGEIVEMLPRRNQLSRRSAVPMPDARPHEQVIVANVDQVVPVLAVAQPAPRWNLLDRYLVLAESLELPALICITKLDLAMMEAGTVSDEIVAELEMYRNIGYPVVLTSSVTGQGIVEFQARLEGRLSVLLGKSGVGKTALLNAVEPGLGLRVREVSRVSGKGKHTTTHMEMFPLTSGGRIIDTPGVQEFGLWDIAEDELIYCFPEMRPFAGKCRFGMDCRHDEEPGCAIRKAVMREEISPRRYQSYMNLIQEIRYDEHRLF